MPAKLVANTLGRRLTHSRPDSTASCSTSLLRSPRNRDGWRAKSSSALIADSATSRVTPAARAASTVAASRVAERARVEEHRVGARQGVESRSGTSRRPAGSRRRRDAG